MMRNNLLFITLCFMVIVFSANSSNSRNNSPRQSVLKSLGSELFKIVHPNRTSVTYTDIIEEKFRRERHNTARLSTKLDRLQAELHEMLHPTPPMTNSTLKEIADRMPVHQNEEFQQKLKTARYLRTGSRDLPLSPTK